MCLLVAMGTTAGGENHLLAIREAVSESTECWERVLRDLRLRGMNPPRLVIADGAGGLREEPDRVFPETRLQRCWVHKKRNVHNYMIPNTEDAASNALRADSALASIKKFVGLFSDGYPKATKCLLDGLPELLAFFDYPAAHWCRSPTPSSRRSRPSAGRLMPPYTTIGISFSPKYENGGALSCHSCRSE